MLYVSANEKAVFLNLHRYIVVEPAASMTFPTAYTAMVGGGVQTECICEPWSLKAP